MTKPPRMAYKGGCWSTYDPQRVVGSYAFWIVPETNVIPTIGFRCYSILQLPCRTQGGP